MLGYISYRAYYGALDEYNDSTALLFYTSSGLDNPLTRVINEPILEWELNSAGNITFILPPKNEGYYKIACKKDHIFIERNGELIWHGRAIHDDFDEDGNREILCEGALNYLLDTTVKPYNSLLYNKATDSFNELIDEHNRSLNSASSVIFGTEQWRKFENNGTIDLSNWDIRFHATGDTGYGLAVYSNPSIWRYRCFKDFKLKISFALSMFEKAETDCIIYGLCLSEKPYLTDANARIAPFDVGRLYKTQENFETYVDLGAGGFDGTGHEDCYIHFYMYFYAKSGANAIISDLKVEAQSSDIPLNEKYFPPREGNRRGIIRAPFADERLKLIDGTEYPTTLDAINSMFIEPYGGYLFVNYSKKNGKVYPVINYIYGDAQYDQIGDDLPEISYRKNIVSCNVTNNYEDSPTILIPLGRKKEEWEHAAEVDNITYYTNKMLDKDGNLVNAQSSTSMVAELPVKPGETYFASGYGAKDVGLYAIVNISNEVLNHKVFNSTDTTRYENESIEIPDGGAFLRVYFYNGQSASPVPSWVFSLKRAIDSDFQEYITLENLIGSRTDYLAGTQYYPLYDMGYITFNGWTEKVVHFDYADSQEDLLRQVSLFSVHFKKVLTSYEIVAVELAPITDQSEYKMIGMPGSYAKVNIPQLEINEKLCVTKCSLNLSDFSKSRYSLANFPPPDIGDLLAKGLY